MTTRKLAQHPSPDASSEVIRALAAYQVAYRLTDYDVADLAGASRDTISRWRRRPVALSAKTIDRLMASLDEEAEATSAAYVELKHALTTAKQALTAAESAPAERLRRRLNERGYRGNAVLAEIHAAGLQVTGKDGS